MPLLFKILLAPAALLAMQSLWSLLDGYRFLAYLRRSLRAPRSGFHPSAVVIVPVKGVDADLGGYLDSLLTQDYPDYRLVFSVAREGDPAHAYLSSRLQARSPIEGRGPREVKQVVAGVTRERGEKVNNLLAALKTVSSEAQVLVFADADARPKKDWLRSLIEPLADTAVMVSTGFRWYLPGRTFASRLRAAWDTSIATMLGEHRSNFAWGGSMAIRATDFRRLQVAERYWAATVSDDYGLTRAVRDAGGWIRFEPKCLVASSDETNWRDFRQWSNRQIIITRVYAPHLWRWGLISHLLFCGTLALGLSVILVPGPEFARWCASAFVIVILLLGFSKARLRVRAASELFPEEAGPLRQYGACYWRLWPLVPWMMLFDFVTAGLTRKIEWRGRRYELRSPTEMCVLGPDV